MGLYDGIVASYNFNGDARDFSGNGYNGTVAGNVTFGNDTQGNYAYFNGTRIVSSGTVADIVIGNKMNFTQTNDFAWMVSIRVDSLPVRGTVSGTLGSVQDCAALINSAGTMQIHLRGSTNIAITLTSNYRATRLGETHIIIFKYVAGETKFYAYLDGVLQNVGGTLGPTTFLCNDWRLGDNAIGAGVQGSCQKYIYKAAIRNRALSDSEIKTISLVSQGNHSLLSDGTYVTPSLSTIGVDTTGIVAMYNMNGNARDASGNGYHGTVTGATLTTDQFGNADSAYSLTNNTDKIKISGTNIDSIFTQTGTYTVATTIYIQSTGINRFIWSYAGGGNNRQGLSLNSTVLGYQLYNGTIYNGRTTSFPSDMLNTWVNVVCVNNGGVLKLYINGVDTSIPGNNYATGTPGNYFNIGYPDSAVNGAGSINGKIGYTKIRNRVLSDSEIKTLSDTLLGKLKQTKGKTLVNNIDTNTPPTTPIKMSQTKGKISFTKLTTV